MPRTYKKTGKPPGRPRVKPKGNPAVDGRTDSQLKAERQERAAKAREAAIEACGPLRDLPAVPPTLFEDMKRAWLVEEHPLDGPGVLNLRKMVKADFLGFMRLYREEEKRDTALSAVRAENVLLKAEVESLRASVPAAGGVDEGEERVRELIERLLKEVEGKPWEK